MPWIPAVIGAAGSIAGGAIGAAAAGGNREAAQAAAQQALKEIEATGLPPDQSAPIFFKYFQQAGLLTPAVEQAINVGTSQLADLKENSSGRDAQVQALNMLQQRAHTGLSAEDRYAINKVRDQIQSDQNSKVQQILMAAQQRGQGGAGATLAAQLKASQSGANSMARDADAKLAQASQNALSAASQSGQLGNQLRQQDWNINAQKASAADEFKRFDLQNRMAVQQRNVDRQNDAQRYNLNMKQAVGNANTQLTNQELLRQREAKRQQWLDTLSWNQSKGNALNGVAAADNAAADRQAATGYGIGSAIGQIGGSLSNYMYGQQQRDYDSAQRDKDRQTYLSSKGGNQDPYSDGYTPSGQDYGY